MEALKFTGILSAVLTLIQSIIWSVFSILGILTYSEQITVATDADSFLQIFYNLYFNKKTENTSPAGVTSPDVVLIWMCVYLAFSVLWSIACIIWLVDLVRGDRPPLSLYLWAGTTALIAILDLTATVWFGTDLAAAQKITSKDRNYIVLSSALMMTMAARGFILYLVNVGLLALTITLTVQQNRKPASRLTTQKAYLNPTMWPEMQQTSTTDTWDSSRRQPPKEAVRFPTFVNPPMSPVYDEMPPREQPPFILRDPPKPRSVPPVQTEEVPKILIPEPDYSPLMNRAYKPMLPVRPALKKSPHMGRTVF